MQSRIFCLFGLVSLTVGCEVDVNPSPDAGGGGMSSGGMSSGGMSGGGGADPTDCSPGDEEPCWESPDGEPFEGEAPEGQSTCHAGERKCQGDGTWAACLGAVGPELADTCEPGNDANCDGTPNEGCECDDGDTRACGSDDGNCQQGEQTCEGDAWGPCEGETTMAAADGCEPDDDANCNGTPNEGCECVNGEETSCGTDIGPCEFGTQTCVNGVYPETCSGGVPAALNDSCEAGNDANCNGTANEGCSCTGSEVYPCGVTQGACELGMQTCEDGTLSGCSVTPTTNDTCYAADDANDTNCNGIYGDGCACVETEEPKVCPDASGCGQQACDGDTGTWNTCVGDGVTLRCNPAAPDNRQVCNENGVWTNQLCSAGSVCSGDGLCLLQDGEACSAAGDCASDSCTSFYLDDDNDTYRANATVVKFCGATQTGYVALASNQGDDCDDGSASVHPGAAEVCDGIDNDCDGDVDLADGLVLSGAIAEVGPVANTRSQPEIAWAEAASLYGVAFEDDSAAIPGVYFTTYNQAGVVQTAALNAGEPSQGAALHLIWGSNNFGLTWFNSGSGDVHFRTVGSNGSLGVIRDVINGAMARPQVARIGTGNWGVSYIDYGSGFGYVGAKTVSAAGAIGSHVDITTENSNVGYLVGTTSNFVTTVELATTSAAATVYSSTFGTPATLTVPGTIPVMGGGPNGFAIALRKAADKPDFYSYDDAGNASCGPVQFADTTFAPSDIVGTTAGYLVVASGTPLRAQFIGSDCSVGPLFAIDAAGGTETRVAGGSAGWGVVWRAPTNKIRRRFFGPKFCD